MEVTPFLVGAVGSSPSQSRIWKMHTMWCVVQTVPWVSECFTQWPVMMGTQTNKSRWIYTQMLDGFKSGWSKDTCMWLSYSMMRKTGSSDHRIQWSGRMKKNEEEACYMFIQGCTSVLAQWEEPQPWFPSTTRTFINLSRREEEQERKRKGWKCKSPVQT